LDGPWAAAGLYQTGLLYYKLFKKSDNNSYYQKAEANFNLLVKNYPKSNYRVKTLNILHEMQGHRPKHANYESACLRPKRKTFVDPQKDEWAKERYFQAEYCYKQLKDENNYSEERLLLCIKKFYSVYRFDSEGRWAAASLYQASLLLYKLYRRTNRYVHFRRAEKYLQQTIKLINMLKLL